MKASSTAPPIRTLRLHEYPTPELLDLRLRLVSLGKASVDPAVADIEVELRRREAAGERVTGMPLLGSGA